MIILNLHMQRLQDCTKRTQSNGQRVRAALLCLKKSLRDVTRHMGAYGLAKMANK